MHEFTNSYHKSAEIHLRDYLSKIGLFTEVWPQLRESELKGETNSNLSRLWQKKATELVQEVQQRDLSHIDLLVLMLDAVELCSGLVATVALARLFDRLRKLGARKLPNRQQRLLRCFSETRTLRHVKALRRQAKNCLSCFA